MKENESVPPTEPKNPEATNAMAALADSRNRIPGDVVNKATADLPDNQRSAIRRLHAHYIENNLSLDEAGKLIGMNGSSVSLLLRGKYPAALTNAVKEIEDFFELHDKRAQGRKLPFIETALTRRIWNVCDASLEFQKIAFIIGEQQIGKTEALKAYAAAHNHGSTIYVRMPTGGALLHLLQALATKLRISDNLNISKLRERILAAFDDRMLLIVDEAHQCIGGGGNQNSPIKSIEFIREIFDEAACGLVICATDVFRQAMDNGPVHKVLKQTKRRRLCTLVLPSKPTQADLNTFAAAYGLPPSGLADRELEKRMIEDEALGMWLTLLRMGAKLAASRKQHIKWTHVQEAYSALRAMESLGK